MCVGVCLCVDMIRLSENIGIVANSLACEIWIVNDITDCKTCLFYVSCLFVLFCLRIVCVRMCVYVSECVCVCVGVNSHACHRWIVNDINDCNSCLYLCFSVCLSILVLCVLGGLCLCMCVYMITLSQNI